MKEDKVQKYSILRERKKQEGQKRIKYRITAYLGKKEI